MRRFIAIFLFAVVFFGCIKENHKGADVKVGDTLPEFEVVMSDGSVITNHFMKGSVSVLMFFHPSCPDCQQTLPLMQTVYDEYAEKGIKFTLISRECGGDEIESYWRENSFNMPYSAQNNRIVYNLFASSRIPRIYISDENGIVRYIFTDDPVASYDDLKYSIESLIR